MPGVYRTHFDSSPHSTDFSNRGYDHFPTIASRQRKITYYAMEHYDFPFGSQSRAIEPFLETVGQGKSLSSQTSTKIKNFEDLLSDLALKSQCVGRGRLFRPSYNHLSALQSQQRPCSRCHRQPPARLWINTPVFLRCHPIQYHTPYRRHIPFLATPSLFNCPMQTTRCLLPKIPQPASAFTSPTHRSI